MNENQIESTDSEIIIDRINENKASLAEKLEHLESEVQNTFANASNSVQEMMQDVKEKFSIPHQVREDPWKWMGISLGAGFLVGLLSARGDGDFINGKITDSKGNDSMTIKSLAGAILADSLIKMFSKRSENSEES